MQHGLPALRHDWRIPVSSPALGATFADYLFGWTAMGLGEPQPYPTFYLIGIGLWVAHFLLNSTWIVGLFVFLTILLASYAALRIARHVGAPYWGQAALALFAALNPWVYSKYVAGHIYMIFAYAVIVALVSEITAERPRPLALLWLAALSITQLEFFLIVAPIVSFWAIVTRRYYVVIVMALAALPIAIGIAAYRNDLLSTPFFLPWQDAQSVPMLQGLALRGYTFHYAQGFQAELAACYALAALALIGAISTIRRPLTATAACVALLSWIFASGTKGAIAPAYRWLVMHVTEVGVFRELYDLIALLAIAYIVLCAMALCRYRFLAPFAALAAAALAIPWIAHPVARYFVPASAIPQSRFVADPATRVVLLPAFQPLTFEGRGSGYDPDLFTRPGEAVPLNGFYPTFPVNKALALADRGDFRYAAALGVAQIIRRPYLTENTDALRYQLAGVPRVTTEAPRSGSTIPLLTLTDPPRIVSIGDSPLENSVFFADAESTAASVNHLTRFRAGAENIDPRTGWIDVRLTVPAHPQWGTPFGGVYTESQAASLPIHDAAYVLARAANRIVTSHNQTVATRSASYRWWRLPPDTASLHCVGACAVLLAARSLPAVPEHHPLSRFNALPIQTILPWLFKASVKHGTTGYIRFNERFDSHWLAFIDGKPYHSQRLDGALNGWRIADPLRGETMYIVQAVALAQAIAEGAALLGLLFFSFALTRVPAALNVHGSYEQRLAR